MIRNINFHYCLLHQVKYLFSLNSIKITGGSHSLISTKTSGTLHACVFYYVFFFLTKMCVLLCLYHFLSNLIWSKSNKQLSLRCMCVWLCVYIYTSETLCIYILLGYFLTLYLSATIHFDDVCSSWVFK